LITSPAASQCLRNASSGLIKSWLSVAAAKPFGKIVVKLVIKFFH
jgi:hypothetical protein